MFLVENWPPYLLAVLSLAIVFLLPGLTLARRLAIRDPALLVASIYMISMWFVYAIVTLFAILKFSPQQWPNICAWGSIIVLGWGCYKAYGLGSRGLISIDDCGFLLVAAGLLVIAYAAYWVKNGEILVGTDVLSSWLPWARIWADGKMPNSAYGYPQFIPAIWSVAYWFLGAPGDVVVSHMYGVMTFAPVLFAGWYLLRCSISLGVLVLLSFAFPIAMFPDTWLRGALVEGYPDWIAVGLCSGALMLLAPACVQGQGIACTRTGGVAAPVIAASMLAFAAATKLVCGLFLLALVVATIVEVRRDGERNESKRLLAWLTGILAMSLILYLVYLIQVKNTQLPPFQRPHGIFDQLRQATNLMATRLGWWILPTAILGLICTAARGSLLSRLLMAAIIGGFALWVRTTAYDVRAILPFAVGALVLSTIVVWQLLHEAEVSRLMQIDGCGGRKTAIPVIAAAAGMLFIISANVPWNKDALRILHAEAQTNTIGLKRVINGPVLTLLGGGCTVASYDLFVYYVDVARGFFPAKLLLVRGDGNEQFSILEREINSGNCVALLGHDGVLANANGILALGEFREFARSGEWRLLTLDSIKK